MGIEFELKFRATEEILGAINQSFSGTEQRFTMETTYYDTPTGALSQRRYTLRRRMENDLSVCTLKAPISGPGRGEWELPCDRIESALSELCKLGAPEDLLALTAGGIIPVCGARFHRITKVLVLPDATLELALDQGILHGGGKTLPLCEVEVELKSGTPEACITFARQLAAAFHLTPEHQSKFRRALALYQGA